MEILLGPLLPVNKFVKTFFVILYHTGQVALMLGFNLSHFFLEYACNFLVLFPSCMSLLPLNINSLFLPETQKKKVFSLALVFNVAELL